MKPQLGFDIAQLNAEMACAFLVAALWVAAALATGVFAEEHRYDQGRVLLTWALAAPIAAGLRVAIFAGALLPEIRIDHKVC